MDYLKVWTSFKDIISTLQDDEIGRLFVMMLKYADTGDEPDCFAGNEMFLWPVAKQQIDMASAKRDILRANGLKGGRPGTKDNQTEPNETKENQTEPDESHNNNIKKSNDNEKETLLTECKEKGVKFVPPTVDEVAEYCRKRGNNVDAQTFVDFYQAKGWLIGKNHIKDWEACVRTWERNNRGNSLPTSKRVSAQQYEQRDYSNEQDEAFRRMLEMGGTG